MTCQLAHASLRHTQALQLSPCVIDQLFHADYRSWAWGQNYYWFSAWLSPGEIVKVREATGERWHLTHFLDVFVCYSDSFANFFFFFTTFRTMEIWRNISGLRTRQPHAIQTFEAHNSCDQKKKMERKTEHILWSASSISNFSAVPPWSVKQGQCRNSVQCLFFFFFQSVRSASQRRKLKTEKMAVAPFTGPSCGDVG